jgi:hypothetical protein
MSGLPIPLKSYPRESWIVAKKNQSFQYYINMQPWGCNGKKFASSIKVSKDGKVYIIMKALPS